MVEIQAAVEALLGAYPPASTDPAEFLRAQFDAGLAFVDLPKGIGGLSADASLQPAVDRALRAAGAPVAARRNPIGVGMGIPTLRRYGSPEQLRRYLRPCFTGEEIWCQLFSEPGSGSDLAALATRATRRGDGWVANGQKVWTSLGHVAAVGLLLARTDPGRPKHRGLTYFLVDMQAAGLEVRPLRQMTGEAEFNEVFLTDVFVPDAGRLGPEGEGWTVALTTLLSERVVLSGGGGGVSNVGGTSVNRLLARVAATPSWDDPVLRDELMRRYIEARVIRMTNERARRQRGAGRPGPEGSITKLFQGVHNRRLQATAVKVAGAAATAWEPDSGSGGVVHGFLRAQANTIEGGTSDIQRNVLGERILGFPKEPGPGPDTPWAQLRRNG